MTADGAFTLMRYQVGNLSKSINSSALTASSSSSSASALAMLPLAVQPSPATQITQGAQGGTFRISLSARTPPSRPLTNIKVTLSLGKGANGVTASVSGGGNGLNGASTGAGRWDVTTGPTPTTAGQGQGQGPEGPVLTWTIDSLSSIDRPAEIQGQFYRSVVPHHLLGRYRFKDSESLCMNPFELTHCPCFSLPFSGSLYQRRIQQCSRRWQSRARFRHHVRLTRRRVLRFENRFVESGR